jgi:hypothetical protein
VNMGNDKGIKEVDSEIEKIEKRPKRRSKKSKQNGQDQELLEQMLLNRTKKRRELQQREL